MGVVAARCCVENNKHHDGDDCDDGDNNKREWQWRMRILQHCALNTLGFWVW